MNFIPRWLAQAVRRNEADEGPDAADMGTAFGLDASFGDPTGPLPEPIRGGHSPSLSRLTGLPRAE